MIEPRPEGVRNVPVPAGPDGNACTNELVAGLKPSVSNPSNASVWVARIVGSDGGRRLLTGAVSGALKAALLIVVIACSVSEPAAPTYQA